MAITPAMIRELREISGAGMTDCKKALDETGGDVKKAVVLLREKGLATAAKKAGRIAAEGLVLAFISDDGRSGIVIEVNSETDFVAKNPEYRSFVEALANLALSNNVNSVDELNLLKFEGDETVADAVKSKIAKFGENITLRRFEKLSLIEEGFLQKYIHGEGKIAVLVQVKSNVVNDAMLEAAKNMCMQITVMRPLFISKDDVDSAFLEQEKDILTKQALNEGKDAAVVEKMIAGRMNKRLKEICLLDQEYIKDNELTCAKYLDTVNKENNADAVMTNFVVFEKGEGIEKKEDNFADEVNKAIHG